MTNARARVALGIAAIGAFLCVTGCAGIGTRLAPQEGTGSARTPTGESVAPQAALRSVALGRSTKAEVAAALGAAIVISFDSGYEVWVYRWRGGDSSARAATELVVLFDPAGVATKARVRPGY